MLVGRRPGRAGAGAGAGAGRELMAIVLVALGGIAIGMAVGAVQQADLPRKPLVAGLLGLIGCLLVVSGLLRL